MHCHLELEVDLVQYRHELSIAEPSKYGNRRAIELDYLKGEDLSPEVVGVIECDL